MAELTKERMREPLAAGDVFQNWSNFEVGERFNLRMTSPVETASGQTRSFNLALTRDEAVRFAIYVADTITRGPDTWLPKPMPDALRKLADLLESKATS